MDKLLIQEVRTLAVESARITLPFGLTDKPFKKLAARIKADINRILNALTTSAQPSSSSKPLIPHLLVNTGARTRTANRRRLGASCANCAPRPAFPSEPSARTSTRTPARLAMVVCLTVPKRWR
jgi:hypothetical protein